jgi:hypothetical protein
VQPNERNGLRVACRSMVDKVTTLPRNRLGVRIGQLDDEDVLRLNQARLVFLGLAVGGSCPGWQLPTRIPPPTSRRSARGR